MFYVKPFHWQAQRPQLSNQLKTQLRLTEPADQSRVTREAAMAKLYATEQAQQVIDRAVQLFGGKGGRAGGVTETLYREIRALRIYDGASEVQKLVIARQELARAADVEP